MNTENVGPASGEKLSYEEILDRYGVLAFTVRGVSMRPMLKQKRDPVAVVKKDPTQRCHYNDVVLFRRDNGQYVLHRVLKVREHDYWIVGDNCISGELIREDQILGVMTSFTRKGKTIDLDNRWYQAYVRYWCDPYRMRMALQRARMFPRRCLSWVKHHIILRDAVK